MRFREEYAVEWMQAGGRVITSDPIPDRRLAEKLRDRLLQRGAIVLAHVISRTVREERPWYLPVWEITGITKWSDQIFDPVDVN